MKEKDYYIGKDGLKYCNVCGCRQERWINILGEKRAVGVMCGCVKRDMKDYFDRMDAEAQRRNKVICFKDARFASCTFDTDDGKDPKTYTALKNYATKFEEFLQDGTGIILYGTSGNGKSTGAAMVLNYIMEHGYTGYMTNIKEIERDLASKNFEDKKNFIESLDRYSLLVIDDLGVERRTPYIEELVYEIINNRYNAKKPLIVTSNLTGEEIMKPNGIHETRIYDRIYEMCIPLKVDCPSRRVAKLHETIKTNRKRLGI